MYTCVVPTDALQVTIRGSVRLLRVMSHCDSMRLMTTTADLIGTAEAASVLGVSHRTVHRLTRDGKLVRALTAPGGFAGAFLFHRADVERLAAQRSAA